MAETFLRRYAVVLLDMNGTFMFGEDRFGDTEDFFATYRALGGSRLGRSQVSSAIERCYRAMFKDYQDPTKMDDFVSIAEGLRRYGGVDDIDIPSLEAVFAHHELGRVPREHAECLRRLSRSHRLGIVSNIWAKKNPWLAEFERAGIGDIWETAVFSSDTRSIKPSPTLFRRALDAVDAPLSDVVFVGDSLRVDIAPAKSLGLNTVWINPAGQTHPLADRTVASLLDLI